MIATHLESLDLQAQGKCNEMFEGESLYVTKSEVHGLTVKAFRNVKKGEKFPYATRNATPEEALNCPYVIWDGNKALKVQCYFRFINDSSDPNVAYCDDGYIHVLRDIPANEEWTHNYNGGEF